LKTKKLTTHFKGKPFNSPNKVFIQGDDIFFTDPPYGYMMKIRPKNE
jgi:hypothetical protein